MTKQKVIFRKFKDGDIIALLPGIPANIGRVMSYMHIGQHGEADSLIVHDTKLAKPEEYADLLAELRWIYESDGDCELVVSQKMQHSDLSKSWNWRKENNYV